MTRAPDNLLAVRRLLLDHLDVDPGKARDQDLEPNEVGIVGDPNHRGGYHCGSDRVVTNDYSVVESSRDKSGLTLDAAALDVGMFQVSVGGKRHDLHTFSVWCVGECERDAPDTRDIREIIYSPDGKVVKRWDRLKRRSTGDRSHLWHTHFSFHRDAIKAGRDQTPLFRRYLQSIGLIEASNDMGGDDLKRIDLAHGERNSLVTFLQRCLEELGTRVAGEAIKVDGDYRDKTAAHVRVAELRWNPKFTGDGRKVTAETWMRIDRMLDDQRLDARLKQLPQPSAPVLDYGKLAGTVDLAQLAARIDTRRLVADLDYRQFAIAVLQALPASAT